MRAILIPAFLIACSAFAETADTWQFAPPDAKVFIGIRWNNVAGTEVGRMLRKKLVDAGFSSFPVFSLLNDIDEAVFVSPGKDEDAPDDKQAPVLIRVSGRFHAAEFERAVEAQGMRGQSYRSRKVFRQKKNGNMAAALLDDRDFLVGDAPSVFAALDRLQWPDPAPNALVDRARRLRDAYDLWALFTVAPSALPGRLLPDLPLMDDTHGLELGVSFQTGLDMRLGLDTDSPDSAAKLATELKKVVKLASKDMRQNPDLAAAARKLQIADDDAHVRLTLRIGAGEVERSMAELHRHAPPPALPPVQAAPVVAAVARTVEPATPPAPPPPQVIHIEGLDDGPKEVPLSR